MDAAPHPDAAFAPRLQLALVGCNHRTAPLQLRERMSFSSEQARRAGEALRLRGILEEAVILSTCNRSELYGVRSAPLSDGAPEMERFFAEFHGLPPDDLDGRVYRYHDKEAVRHLFRVASGLDSMLLGEAEILGQVRDAYTRALAQGSTGPVLNRLFQGALEIGKRVRSETTVGAGPMSLAFAGVKLAERVFGDLAGHSTLIVGAGAVAEQVAEHLRHRRIGNMRVVNRSTERARDLARRVDAQAADWSSLEGLLESPDVVVTSVAEAGIVLSRAMLECAMAARGGRPIFFVDLGIPRNVDPGAAELNNVYVYNIDDLGQIVEQNKKAREAEIPRAEALIAQQMAKFAAWQSSLEVNYVLEQLRQRLDGDRRALVERRLASLTHLSHDDRLRIARLTEEVLDRVLRHPAAHLRRARETRLRISEAQALLRLFGVAADNDDLTEPEDT